MRDEDENVLGEDEFKMDDELELPPEEMEDDFGLEDPDDNYH